MRNYLYRDSRKDGTMGTMTDTRIHKASPQDPSMALGTHCEVCGQRVHRVPGGQGVVWVHSDTGAVAAPSPPDRDSYNGYANRETRAFNLHWQNDQGLYNETLEFADSWLRENDVETGLYDPRLGEAVVDYWRQYIYNEASETGDVLPESLRMMRDEVGSWWRIDHTEVGAAVREALDIESD